MRSLGAAPDPEPRRGGWRLFDGGRAEAARAAMSRMDA